MADNEEKKTEEKPNEDAEKAKKTKHKDLIAQISAAMVEGLKSEPPDMYGKPKPKAEGAKEPEYKGRDPHDDEIGADPEAGMPKYGNLPEQK